MSLALYRKYRPQSWSDVTNQNHIKITLRNEIEGGKVSHAYLFTGPRGIGKTTTARLLAKAINCEKRKPNESEPCNKCDSCLELVEGNDLDILEIDAASHTGVDNVRENIIANARFTPVKRKFKVFIIDEVHMLSVSAFNALLKILEEPPSHAIFILATTEIHKVPATIISRCQRFDFKKINAEELIKRLGWICQQEGIKISKNVLTSVARVSDGCLRDAESLLGQILSLGEKEITDEEASLILPSSNVTTCLELANDLVYKNTEASLGLINKLVEEGGDLQQFADDFIELLRKMMLTKICGGLKELTFNLDAEQEKSIIDLAQKFNLQQLIDLINLFSQKKNEIKTAPIPQLPLEIAIIQYCTALANKNDSDWPKPGADGSGGGLKPDSKNVKADTKSGAHNTTLKSSNFALGADSNRKSTLNLQEIKAKWHNFLVRMQDENASLVFILKVAEPMELTGNILKIGFSYSFHEQRVNQAKIRETVERILSEFFSEKLCIDTCLLAKDYDSQFIKEETKQDEVELVQEMPTATEDQQELINTLVKTFNGKIIE